MRIFDLKVSYSPIEKGRQEPLLNPGKIVKYIQSAFDEYPLQESIYVILLNRKMIPLGRSLLGIGGIHSATVSAREYFRAAILGSASTTICVHNHPSGDPTPSPADYAFTNKLVEQSRLMEIHLKDHIIIGNKHDDPTGLGYFSFKVSGAI